MKKNIDFYFRDSNSHNHPKFKMLRIKYGWDYEAKFWALNDIIASSDECKLDISKKYVVASICHDLHLKEDEFEEFLSFLINDCNLIIKENNCITTKRIQGTYLKIKKDRERKSGKRSCGKPVDKLLISCEKPVDKKTPDKKKEKKYIKKDIGNLVENVTKHCALEKFRGKSEKFRGKSEKFRGKNQQIRQDNILNKQTASIEDNSSSVSNTSSIDNSYILTYSRSELEEKSCLLLFFKKKFNIVLPESVYDDLFKKYSHERIKNTVERMPSEGLHSPIGYLKSALKKNWALDDL